MTATREQYRPTGGLTWGRRFGDAADQVGHGIAADAAGNSVLTGGFGGTLAVDTVVLGAGSASDAFLVKLDATGHGAWGRRFTDASGTQRGLQVALDAAGDISTSGEYSGAIDLGTGPLPSGGAVQRYVAKLDGAGNLLWSHAFLGDGFDLRMAVAPAGDVSVGGSYTDALSLAGIPFFAQGGFGAYDIFVARFSH